MKIISCNKNIKAYFNVPFVDTRLFIITLKGLLAICVRACFCWLLFGVLKIVESSVRRRKKWIDDILVRYLYIHPRIPQYSGWLVFFWQPINFLEKRRSRAAYLFSFFSLFVLFSSDDTDVIFFLIIFYLDGGRMDILFIYRDGTIWKQPK